MPEHSFKLSVIIPIYNSGTTVFETLTSVLKQTTRAKLQVIVVNDGSTDDSLAIALAFQKRFDARGFTYTVITQPNSGGVAGSRNTGLKLATGEFVTFLDGDDAWDSRFVDRLLELQNDCHVDIAFCNAVFFGEIERKDRCQTFMDLYPAHYPVTLLDVISRKTLVPAWALFRRSLLIEGDSMRTDLSGVEDTALWITLLKRGASVDFTTEPLFRYRRRTDAVSKNAQFMLEKAISLYQELVDDSGLEAVHTGAARDVLQKYLSQLTLLRSKQAMAMGQFSEARTLLKEAASTLDGWKPKVAWYLLRFCPRLLQWYVQR